MDNANFSSISATVYRGVNKLYIILRHLHGFGVRGVKSTRGIWAPHGFPGVNL